MSIFMTGGAANAQRSTPNAQHSIQKSKFERVLLLLLVIEHSEGFRRRGLRALSSTFLTRPPRVVVPEIEHRLAEMFDDVSAVEIDVFNNCSAFFAIKNDVLV